ncbi:MAG: allantoin permease, partial [Betaproteobacteria bacterium]|nr:allantoin permease [Betaproteobacteria bacterium]
LLSSVFVPLYGVILGRLATGDAVLATSGKKIDWTAAGLWLMGIACYHLLANVAPQWGSALPTLALTFTLAWLTRTAPAGLLEVRA